MLHACNVASEQQTETDQLPLDDRQQHRWLTDWPSLHHSVLTHSLTLYFTVFVCSHSLCILYTPTTSSLLSPSPCLLSPNLSSASSNTHSEVCRVHVSATTSQCNRDCLGNVCNTSKYQLVLNVQFITVDYHHQWGCLTITFPFLSLICCLVVFFFSYPKNVPLHIGPFEPIPAASAHINLLQTANSLYLPCNEGTERWPLVSWGEATVAAAAIAPADDS